MPVNLEDHSEPPAPYTDDSPAAPYTDDSPATPYTDDSPAAPYTDDSPAAPYTDDSPAAPYTDDSPPDVIAEPVQVNWQEINQVKISQLNQINQQIVEQNQQYKFIQNLYKEALQLQQWLNIQLSESRNEIPAAFSDVKVNELIESTYRNIVTIPLQSTSYGERLSSVYDDVIREANIRLNSIKNAVSSYSISLKDIQKDINLKRQELSENNAENKRVKIFKEHLDVIDKVCSGVKVDLSDFKNLEFFSQPIKRFSKSEFQGVPNINGETLMSFAASQLNISQMRQLYRLGYKLIYHGDYFINPFSMVMKELLVEKVLEIFGNSLFEKDLNEIFESYLLPLMNSNLKFEFTVDRQKSLIFIINNKYCSKYSKEIFNLVFNRSEMLNHKSSLVLKYFNYYQKFIDLSAEQRVEFIVLILTEMTQFDKQQQHFVNLYTKEKKLYAVNLLSDFKKVEQFDKALTWVIDSKLPLNIVNNELLAHAYLAYQQGKTSLLTNSLSYNQPQVKQWFNSLEINKDQPKIKFDLICINAGCFDIRQLQGAFSELDTNDINNNFDYLYENVDKNNSLLTTFKVLTIFCKQQISKTQDLESLLKLSNQVSDVFERVDGSDKYKELILKQIKNKMLSILKINSDIEPTLKIDIKLFMASHRTKGWSLFCGLLYIPPTLLSTPSSKIYDQIINDNKEQAELKLSKQQQNFEVSYEKLFGGSI